MRVPSSRVRLWCAVALICAGGLGILFSPSLAVFISKELHSFTLTQLHEHEWGTSIITSTVDLPFVRNGRGIWYMNACLAGSIGAIFGGVHWLAGLRRKLRGEAS